MGGAPGDGHHPELLRRALAGEITTVYQPVVDLETHEVLGFEALSRGPEGSALEAPNALLEAGRELGRLPELDWLLRARALHGGLDAGLGSTQTLFVNVEAEAGSPPSRYDKLLHESEMGLRVVIEVTERSVVEQPAYLLRTVQWARRRSWGVAVDDLGADPGSLAMMPFLEPDVVKLDLRLVQQRPTPEIGLIVSAVLAQSERHGAVIMAEGIETETHLEAALAMGATVGQGWLFGKPAPLPQRMPSSDSVIRLQRRPASTTDLTPFSILRSARPMRRGSRHLLAGIVNHLEEQALGWHDAPVILCSARAFEDSSLSRYGALARQGCFVALLGPDVVTEPAPGVRGIALARDHRLQDEWAMVIIGPHYAGAMVGREFHRGGRDHDTAYDFAVTHDRALVVDAGRALLRHL